MGRKRALPKWEDYTLVSLERRYHVELEQIGVTKFEERYKINLYKEALIILSKWIFNEENNGKRD